MHCHFTRLQRCFEQQKEKLKHCCIPLRGGGNAEMANEASADRLNIASMLICHISSHACFLLGVKEVNVRAVVILSMSRANG
jgi:hypothetical protein